MSYTTVYTPKEVLGMLTAGSWPTRSVSYSFPLSLPSDYLAGLHFSSFSLTQIAAAKNALALFADISNIQFTDAGTSKAADIRMFNLTEVGSASTYLPGPNLGGDSIVNGSNPLYAQPALGNYAYMTMIHELGHAMGLSHPGMYNGGTPVYEKNAAYQQDTLQFTVMSYFDASKTGADHFYKTQQYAETLLLHDIMAIQSIYGVDMTTRAGDTTYGFHSNAGLVAYDFVKNPDPVICIWDAGGVDTLDFSGFTTATRIDLNPGAFSDTPLMGKNVSIAYRAIIENAKGGSGNDVIFGNAAANTIYGGAGNDQINGRTGADKMYGGSGDDIYFVDDTADLVAEAANAGTDEVRASASFTLRASIETLLLLGDAAISGTGNEGDNRIVGNTGANKLSGAGGNDRIVGGWGDDVVYGGAGNDVLIAAAKASDMGYDRDVLYGGSGDDTYVIDHLTFDTVVEAKDGGADTVIVRSEYVLPENVENLKSATDETFVGTGNAGANFLTGGAGNDRLYGGGGDDVVNGLGGNDELHSGDGADRLVGGAGNDRYYIDDARAVVVELENDGFDVIASRFTFTIAANVEAMYLTGLAPIDAYGNDAANILSGSDAANSIFGLGGNDSLYGEWGDDLLQGGAGDDLLVGGRGQDQLFGDDGADQFEFSSFLTGDPALGGAIDVDAIGDFVTGEDHIRLLSFRFSVLTVPGVLADSMFFVGDAAHDEDDRIIYDTATGALSYDSDGNAVGGKAAIHFATLSPALTLSAADIIVY